MPQCQPVLQYSKMPPHIHWIQTYLNIFHVHVFCGGKITRTGWLNSVLSPMNVITFFLHSCATPVSKYIVAEWTNQRNGDPSCIVTHRQRHGSSASSYSVCVPINVALVPTSFCHSNYCLCISGFPLSSVVMGCIACLSALVVIDVPVGGGIAVLWVPVIPPALAVDASMNVPPLPDWHC